MAMYAQLGSTIFKGLFGMESFSRSRSVKTVDVELLNNKPRTQRTGENLAELSISVVLAAEYVADIAETIAGFYTSMATGEVLPLLGGDGTVFGDFIIIEIGETVQDLSPSGTVTEASISLTLKEWVDPNPTKTIAATARKNAFAVGVEKVVPVNVLAQGETIMGATVKSVRTQQNAAAEATVLIEKSRVSPSELFSFFKRAIGKIDITRTNAQKLVLDLLKNVALQELAPGLLDIAQQASFNADNVRIALQTQNLTAALSYSEILASDLVIMREKSLPLDKIILQRKPQ